MKTQKEYLVILLISLFFGCVPQKIPSNTSPQKASTTSAEYYKGSIYLMPNQHTKTGIIKVYNDGDPREQTSCIPGILFHFDSSRDMGMDKGDTVYFQITKQSDIDLFASNIVNKKRAYKKIDNCGSFTINIHGFSNHGNGSHKAGHLKPIPGEHGGATRITTETGVFTLYEFTGNQEDGKDTLWNQLQQANEQIDYFLGAEGESIGNSETGIYHIVEVFPHTH